MRNDDRSPHGAACREVGQPSGGSLTNISRRSSLTLLLVTLLFVLGSLLTGGCSGGAKPDNLFQGTYRSAYVIPGLNQSGTFTYTVGQKGGMTGSFTDAATNRSLAFNGQLENNGAFSGDMVDGANRYSVGGTFSNNALGGSGEGGASSGGGDFRVTINGVEYTGNFAVGGTLPDIASSTFRGAYSGAYSLPGAPGGGLSIGGSVTYSVDQAGLITGSMTRGSGNSLETGFLTGTVQNSGQFNGTVTFPSAAGTPVPIGGTLISSTDGSTVGNFTQSVGGVTYPGTFGRTEVTAGDSPYIGAYRGTYALPENSESGNISFTVVPDGSLIGFFSQSANQPVGAFAGNIGNDGTFRGTITYEQASGLAPRAIVGRFGISAVGGRQGGDFVMTIDGTNRPGNFEVGIGGSEPDSIYRGSYGSSNAQDGFFLPNGSGGVVASRFGVLSLTVDKQGAILGTFTPTLDRINTIQSVPQNFIPPALSVKGIVSNDGRFVATIGSSSASSGFRLQGKLSRQGITYRTRDFVAGSPADTTVDPPIAAIPDQPAVFEFRPGVAGDFLLTVNNVEYPGAIAAIGGNAEGANPR